MYKNPWSHNDTSKRIYRNRYRQTQLQRETKCSNRIKEKKIKFLVVIGGNWNTNPLDKNWQLNRKLIFRVLWNEFVSLQNS